MTEPIDTSEDFTEAVAVIGMAARFPGARDVDEFWRNLRDGVESVRRFTDEEMLAEGIDPATLANPSFVRIGSILDDVELFDAAFFGFSPREAEVLDPQQRVFMECAWEALERAGYAVDGYDGWIGLFAGISMSSYLWKNLVANPQVMAAVGEFQAILSNDRDYFTTRVSYKLNLKGPSINVQTACSTSLVAVHLACQSLLSYQSTIALAGGVRINFPRHMGYFHQEGGIFSPDGHCRAFDAQGAGALFGEGVGVVVLKRLSEALADGDTIHAVIKATAINNDGSGKVGYTAPSVDGQAEAIALAHAVAGVDPETITYVEAHGSGTPLGDPIEVAALTQAFRAGTDKSGFCGLGSVKTNVGHLEAAAGIAGFLKTVLALENRTLPPSLHFETPNPRIDFASSPFYVNTETREWAVPDGAPRRAGVSSFGMGGTNVHAVLEEAPEPEPAEASRPWQLLVLSARTETALEAVTDRLAAWLEAHPGKSLADLADIAWTLQAGRRAFDFRRVLVCRGHDDAVKALAGRDPRRLFGSVKEPGDRPVVWMLSGLGEHHLRMGEGLYRDEPSFREEVDRCAGLLQPLLGVDLREALYPGGVREEDLEEGGFDLKRLLGRGSDPAGPGRLAETWLAQPALFVIEVALARLWRERGVEPAALVGYSLGEYTAAHLAGVMPLETALRVVAEWAKMIQQLPSGAMLAVPLPEEEAVRLLGTDLSLAAVNGPAFSVVAGPVEAVADLESRLATEGLTTRRLETTHAFHSRMMDPIAPRLAEILRRADLRAPDIPLISNVTGTWMTAGEATDPEYWARHLRQPVRFGAGLEELRRDPARLLLEVGPGQALATLALQHPSAASSPVPVLRSMRHPHESRADSAMLLEALGKLWLAGVEVDWAGVHTGERRRRVPLPTYPFERQRFFIELRSAPAGISLPADTSGAKIPPEVRGPKPAPGLGQHARPNLRTVFVAPRNELEEGIATIWRELLGLREVGVHDGFFDLGGNSLVAPQLVLALRDRFGVDLPVAALFDLPTVGDLAGAVERIRQEGTAAVLGQQAPVDLRAEVTLDPEINAAGLPVADWRNPRAVVLTGSTGFLGAFLLRDLLEMTSARVFCPARADSAAEAGERVRRNLESRGLWREGYADRIVPLAADLGQPLWGLSEDEFGRLAKETDAVYHCGAWVNFLYPYRVLKPINVQGTVEALRLAGSERVKAVHFVSSVSAISFRVFASGGWACEDQDLVHTEGLFGGYGESKWVAEQIVNLAQERGIPATIHRPGVVSGDSLTGAGNTRDMIWNMMKGCIQLGLAPERDFPIDVTPVDYVSRAIVHLSLRPDSIGHAFHFPNPTPLRWTAALPFLRSRGYEVETVSHRQWQRTASEIAPRIPDSALLPFLPLLAPPQTLAEEARLSELELPAPPAAVDPLEPRYDATNTEAGLAGSGITCPPVDETLLSIYLDYFVRIGWLPEPREVERAAGVEEALTP